MTARQQLTLLRVVRVASGILGIAIMVPSLSGPHGSVALQQALPFLIGIAVTFLPSAIVGMAVPARCSACGKNVFLKVKYDLCGHSCAGTEEGEVHAFTWKCNSCGKIESIRSTRFDRLITPRFTSSSGTSESYDVGE